MSTIKVGDEVIVRFRVLEDGTAWLDSGDVLLQAETALAPGRSPLRRSYAISRSLVEPVVHLEPRERALVDALVEELRKK